MLDNLLWVVIIGGIACFGAAMGIGANDCGNAMASSVGAKTLTLRQAVVVSAVFEFAGAFLLGSHVTDTIRKGIADAEQFEDRPDLLMFGMFCVVISVAVWLALATYLELPVSTTHTCVGGVIGVAIVARGWEAVHWDKVGMIVASWFASPVLSGLCSMALFLFVRWSILRTSSPAERAMVFFPVLVGLTTAVNAFFILYKGMPVFPALKKTPLEVGIGASIGFGVLCAVITHFAVVPCIKSRMSGMSFNDEAGAVAKTDDSEVELAVVDPESPPSKTGDAAETKTAKVEAETKITTTVEEPKIKSTTDAKAAPESGEVADTTITTAISTTFLTRGLNADVHATAEGRGTNLVESKRVQAIHANAERFTDRTEHSFTYLQVFTACLDALSHGANDTANSLGPFAAVYGIYVSGVTSSKAPVPWWILFIGAAGIVVGLAFFGYKIIAALGTKMTKITPSRGFAIELGAALVIIAGSRLGIPLSTTHCQVGSTIGLGLMEKNRALGVNWGSLPKIFAAWALTLVFAALFSGGLYSFAAYAPSAISPVLINTTAV